MLGAGRVSRDERQIDLRRGDARQLDLGLFGGLLQALQRHLVGAQVDPVVALELVGKIVDETLVEIVAAEAVIAGRGEDLLHTVAHFDDGNVEGAAAEVVDHDLLTLLLIDAVGQGGRRRLIDDAADVEAGDDAGVLGGLALCVIEVGRHGNDGVGDLFAEISLRISLQLLEDHGGDLLRGVLLAVDVYFIIAAHFTLDGGNGAVGVGDGLPLGNLPDHAFAGLGKGHD